MALRQQNSAPEQTPDLHSIHRLQGNMRSLLRSHKLQYFVVSYFPEADKSGLLENLLATNWPRELLVKYERTDMFRESKIVAGLRRTILPICSQELLHARARDGVKCELLGIFYDDGFANTIGLSVHDSIRTQYLIMLSGQRLIEQEEELAGLLLGVMKAIDALAPPEFPEDLLSPRILDCLRWSAAGKSSEDIAMIMDISTHTVNDYLKIAMKRLNAVTRTQAVAIASRLRII